MNMETNKFKNMETKQVYKYGNKQVYKYGNKPTCGSLLSEAIPPPPRQLCNTKLKPFIPGTSYLKRKVQNLIKYMYM